LVYFFLNYTESDLEGFIIYFCFIFLTLGLLIISGILSNKKNKNVRKNWVKVKGKLCKAEIVEENSEDSIQYKISVLYEFEWKGILLKGDNVGFGYQNSLERKTIENYIEKLKSSDSLEVYVNPKFPQESTLLLDDIDNYNNAKIKLGLGCLVFIILFFGLSL